MQSLWKNPVISNVAKQMQMQIKYCPKSAYSQSLLSMNRSIMHLNQFSHHPFCSSVKDQKPIQPTPELKVNGTDMSQRHIDLDNELPGKPDFMSDDYDEYQELEVLGLHDTEIQSKPAPDSRMFNPDYDPDYDPNQEDQIEVGGKKEKAQHRIIKSSVKEDVVIEMEGISSMERLYTLLVIGASCYCGMLAVRWYFMRDALKKQKEEEALSMDAENASATVQTS